MEPVEQALHTQDGERLPAEVELNWFTQELLEVVSILSLVMELATCACRKILYT